MTGNPEWYLGQFGASNRAHWIKDWTVTDTEDVPINVTSANFSISITNRSDGSLLLSGTEADIISFPFSSDNNVFRWTFTPEQMRTLDPGPYNIGVTIKITGSVTQLFTGTLMIYDGVVT